LHRLPPLRSNDGMASKDIQPILEGWSYEPGRITVRKIMGRDSTIKIQMRVDLGVLQMEPTGRPDGQRPEGFESHFERHVHRLREHVERHETDLGFFLAPEDCRQLREEAALYYQRYLALLVLEDYEGVVRDTSRNLQVVDFCHRYALEESDRLILEQFRPYLIMMNTRAQAHQALNVDQPRKAMAVVDRGLRRIRRYFEEAGRPEAYERSGEVHLLNEFRSKVSRRLPSDPVSQLRRRLVRAVDAERYEDAARLRDEIERLLSSARAEPTFRGDRQEVSPD